MESPLYLLDSVYVCHRDFSFFIHSKGFGNFSHHVALNFPHEFASIAETTQQIWIPTQKRKAIPVKTATCTLSLFFKSVVIVLNRRKFRIIFRSWMEAMKKKLLVWLFQSLFKSFLYRECWCMCGNRAEGVDNVKIWKTRNLGAVNRLLILCSTDFNLKIEFNLRNKK